MSGNYLPSHNPFVDFASIRNNPSQCNNVVPYSNAAGGPQQHDAAGLRVDLARPVQ